MEKSIITSGKTIDLAIESALSQLGLDRDSVSVTVLQQPLDKIYLAATSAMSLFAAVDALIVTKCDYLPLNEDFDMDRLKEQARLLNPALDIFVTSARTGEGMAELADWMQAQRAEKVQG